MAELGIDLDVAVTAFRHLQGRGRGWRTDRGSPRRTRSSAPALAARFDAAATVTDEQVAEANAVRALVRAAVCDATRDGTILVIPGAAGVAPRPDVDPETHAAERLQTLRLTCIAGLAGAPVVVAPLATLEGLPLGIGFVGARWSDRSLLGVVRDLVDESD